MTLESVVIARRMYSVLKYRAENGTAGQGDHPLLFYVGALLDKEDPGAIPWDKFSI